MYDMFPKGRLAEGIQKHDHREVCVEMLYSHIWLKFCNNIFRYDLFSEKFYKLDHILSKFTITGTHKYGYADIRPAPFVDEYLKYLFFQPREYSNLQIVIPVTNFYQ